MPNPKNKNFYEKEKVTILIYMEDYHKLTKMCAKNEIYADALHKLLVKSK